MAKTKFRKQIRNLYHQINNMVYRIIKALIIHKAMQFGSDGN